MAAYYCQFDRRRHRDLIIALAARHRVPAVYPFRFYVADGGLMSYGVDQVELFRQAASYVDRILRGGSPLTSRYRHRPNTRRPSI